MYTYIDYVHHGTHVCYLYTLTHVRRYGMRMIGAEHGNRMDKRVSRLVYTTKPVD
jgi:hypothetical protein